MSVFLRNLDPRRIAAVPVSPGWARLLHPGVTAQVPVATVALPAVQRLLTDGALVVVTEVSRMRNAAELLRRDMAAAIAAAEAREMAVLVARQVRQHGSLVRQPPVRTTSPASPYFMLKGACSAAGLAEASLLQVMNNEVPLPAWLGLPPPLAQRSEGKRTKFVHWRQRDRTAAAWLEAVQLQRKLEDPAAAATWLARQLAATLPAPPEAGGALPRWQPGRTALLRQRWAEGASVPDIAAELGVSRSAILGRAARLELPGRHGRLHQHGPSATSRALTGESTRRRTPADRPPSAVS